jgi:competence protein CoiA
MLWANLNGEKIMATPRAKAWCPGCGSQVIAKCGEIVIWHWAHESREECDPWHECESAWHLGWKRMFPPEQCEVVMGPHRADIVDKGGMVIELQHSAISPAEIRERELFYRPGMLWIIDASPFQERLYFPDHARFPRAKWTWDRPRESMLAMLKSVYFDFPDGRFLHVSKLHPTMASEWLRSPSGAFWGLWVNKAEFIRKIGGNPDAGQGLARSVS